MPDPTAPPAPAEAPPAVPRLRIDVLGPATVSVDGAPLAVDTRKAVAVLVVLAVAASGQVGEPGPAGRVADADGVSRAELAALLWPGADEARARATLRRTLSVLVAATGGTVVAGRDRVTLVPDAVTSDVVTFRRLARSADRDDLARAVGLVRGELLAGFALRDSPAFDDWLATTSDALRRELGGVLERLVLARLRHGEWHAALADTARWLELDPLHEAAHRSFMRLLAWTGRRQDALDHYRRCVRVLAEELGVAPVRATTAVYEAIRDGTLAPPRRPAADGPAETSAAAPVPGPEPEAAEPVDAVPMVGRAEPLARLASVLGRGGRLVVVTGEAGAGRTRLVEEFLATVERPVLVRAHGGEASLPFAPVTDLLRAAVELGAAVPGDVAVELSRLLPELLPAGAPPAPPLSTLGARDRFLDAVVRLLAGCGASAVVVEDVHSVGVAAAEVLAYLIHRLDRLRCPLVLTWRDPGLPARHPVQLAVGNGRHHDRTTTIALGRLARADVARLALDHGLHPDAVWRDTAGLPLLVVAAVRSGGAELPFTVRDLLAARLAEVSEETAQVLTALAVLDGPAAPEDLQAVSGRTEAETVDAVEEALRVGVVREEAGGVAFAHDALRRVAYEDSSLLRRRLLHRRAAETLAARRDATLLAPAIASHHHRGGDDARAAEWAWTAARSARALHAHEEALQQLQFAASLGRVDAEVILATGDALLALARYDAARDAYTQALGLVVDDAARAEVERRMADLAVRRGEWARADGGLQSALDLAGPGSPLRPRLLADRAVVAVRAGDPRRARDLAAAALAATPGPDPYVRDVAGIVALADGEVETAAEHFGAALAAGPDLVLRAAVLNNLATAQAAAGRLEAAVATAREALALGRRLGDRHRLAALHANLADRLHGLGTTAAAAEAMTHLKESAALFAEVGADPLDRPDVWTLTTW